MKKRGSAFCSCIGTRAEHIAANCFFSFQRPSHPRRTRRRRRRRRRCCCRSHPLYSSPRRHFYLVGVGVLAAVGFCSRVPLFIYLLILIPLVLFVRVSFLTTHIRLDPAALYALFFYLSS